MSEGTKHARVRAELLVDQGRWAEAERSLREALVQEPNDAEALFMLAACQYRMDGREKDALETIERAIAVEPSESSLHALFLIRWQNDLALNVCQHRSSVICVVLILCWPVIHQP